MFYTVEVFLQYYVPYFLHLGCQLHHSRWKAVLILLIPRLLFQPSQVYFLVLFAFHHFAHDKASYLLYAQIVRSAKNWRRPVSGGTLSGSLKLTFYLFVRKVSEFAVPICSDGTSSFCNFNNFAGLFWLDV